MNRTRLTSDQVRAVDRRAIEDYGMSGLVLMENAGRGAAEVIHRITSADKPIAILCGKGNNAGDGYVIARHLELLGHLVRVVSIVDIESLSADAAVNANIAIKSHLPIRVARDLETLTRQIADAAVLVDCVLGTGAKGAPRGFFGEAIRAANDVDAIRVAIDVPSGLDADTGEPSDPTFRANLTLTFVAEKIGFGNETAKPFIGNVEVIPIGVPQKLLLEVLP
ncbi:Bifunctional NAD(P)H-hydrate repair enzyme Nnr [Novipirellula aureliae]|uniref:NAD(P)H-hydrate epimerase n=1 Tax=Novipirellula aureliae TaxID=2527966 RepID=A0A5C6DBT3_9BACT|nr:NAD(P)H-hydrate epimerase [Novipirellula aureliae]TWU34168.1 Bifunctional NAD(P)H-hydrate repair enzyme Nnr [Novipirellula aureliae]